MSELSIKLHWQRSEAEPQSGKYSNEHTVRYNDNYALQVDAAPDWGGQPGNINPEQALAASLSSCHMMTFLALAAKAKWPVTSLRDYAVAHPGKNARGLNDAKRRNALSKAMLAQLMGAFAEAATHAAVRVIILLRLVRHRR